MSNLSNQPSWEQLLAQQKKIKLTTEEEFLAISIKRTLYLAFTLYMSPLIFNDLKSKGKDEESFCKIDAYSSLKIMIEEFKNNPQFFDHHDQDTQRILDTAMLGRNAVIHTLLPLLLLDGGTYLLSWISVCQLINQTEAADQLQRIYEQIYTGADSHLRNQTDFDYSLPDFVKQILRPDNMSMKDFELSLIIQVKMFEAESETLGPVLRDYLVNQPGGYKYYHSVMDSKSYLKDLIELEEQKKLQLSQAKASQSKIKLLKKAKFARNKLCHAELIPLLVSHEEFLHFWIEVCDLLGKPEASARIRVIRNELKSLST